MEGLTGDQEVTIMVTGMGTVVDIDMVTIGVMPMEQEQVMLQGQEMQMCITTDQKVLKQLMPGLCRRVTET